MTRHEKEKPFIDRDKLYGLIEEKARPKASSRQFSIKR